MNRLGAAVVIGTLLTVLVPVTAAEAAPERGRSGAAACTADTGPYQWQLERYLGRKADGRQSVADCEAIRRFQAKHEVRPANGYANLWTYRMMLVAQAGKNPNKAGKCPVRRFKVVCVDMNRQLLWVQRGRKVLFGPVPMRTGRDGRETRRGWHRIYMKRKIFFSSLYNNAPMPYSQFFDRGQALHGTPHDLYNGGGSAGCVNLRLPDAKRLWTLLKVRNWVYVWGTKPGTVRGDRADLG
ncbi:L,D-transpeptidase [Streptomyces kanamyceticus]|uniref:L,D-transpeptidase n=1 Tax=Streptomyces kanamyceticus TaxID=1967 RepID=A0A5J6GHA1_STRKN|nr:L,D-transpeptidase [Streptomyces kanamyceticus]QEU93238.1 L,D-transpeptidase [Streptomyces kanamyceticus]